jgi:hypothetical protein
MNLTISKEQISAPAAVQNVVCTRHNAAHSLEVLLRAEDGKWN